jgi:hypothetical protein
MDLKFFRGFLIKRHRKLSETKQTKKIKVIQRNHSYKCAVEFDFSPFISRRLRKNSIELIMCHPIPRLKTPTNTHACDHQRIEKKKNENGH